MVLNRLYIIGLPRKKKLVYKCLVSISCSYMSFPASADSATSESTNQSMMTVIGKIIIYIISGVPDFLSILNWPFSLSVGYIFLRNGTGLFSYLFFLGRPMMVFWAPLGLPRFLIFGGSFTLVNPVEVTSLCQCCNSQVVSVHTHLCMYANLYICVHGYLRQSIYRDLPVIHHYLLDI